MPQATFRSNKNAPFSDAAIRNMDQRMSEMSVR